MESDSDGENEFMGRFMNPRHGVISEILADKLFLGDVFVCNNVETLKSKGIVRVISIGDYDEQSSYKEHENIDYFWIYLSDTFLEPIDKYFKDTFEFIQSSPGPVLVHCWAGVSRSASIVIAYLMKLKNLSFLEAYQHVKKYRNIIDPNEGFCDQLVNYENMLKKENK